MAMLEWATKTWGPVGPLVLPLSLTAHNATFC